MMGNKTTALCSLLTGQRSCWSLTGSDCRGQTVVWGYIGPERRPDPLAACGWECPQHGLLAGKAVDVQKPLQGTGS